MERSKVYFTDFRTQIPLPQKLQNLMRMAGFNDLELEGRFVAIKMHFGELGNLAFLRPNYAKAVADMVKEKGGRPFLTDSNTLYPGFRKNALDHLDCANLNGFNTVTTGCQIIIGDGLKGTDDVAVQVPECELIDEAYIGRAVTDADVIISLSHFKGHEATGFGGAIKNLGMGCASRAGKMHQHNFGKPVVEQELCRNCHRCSRECGSDAIKYENGKAFIDPELCKGCGRCIGACAFDAIHNVNDNANEILGRKMAEYAYAVCKGKPHFHIAIANDISPNCDCHSENDAPILPDLGMFASFDPVALDSAAADMAQKSAAMPNSQLSDNLNSPGWKTYNDVFFDSNPNIRWKETLEQAEKVGLGTREYELFTMR